ncbi:MAG: hypothetical protein IPM31_08865 [Anaerolineae bacterium]|nr:hypothetical protein [Anaerolineae bacterium]MBL8107666.1 hypothetical protein [Anaerolineales bacterium]MCC7190031.1 hypothetical protein [Anaerolineales bacterium]
MHTGMLWFDDTQSTLDTKIKKATEYYKKKYGRMPDLCLVHPNMMRDSAVESEKPALRDSEGITVRAYRPVLPGHIWVGVEDKN